MSNFLEERLKPIDPRANDWRTPYERDFGRILHSSSFRRLQGKTQVMGIDESDFHRTRLTHSLEVAQIGVSLAKAIKSGRISSEGSCNSYHVVLQKENLLEDLTVVVNTACHAHDLGHPPFGHNGERTLHSRMTSVPSNPENAKMGKIFEGNAQTLRLLTRLETYDEEFGINPTIRTIFSIIKYPVRSDWYGSAPKNDSKPHKCIYNDDFERLQDILYKYCKNDFDLFTEKNEHEKGKNPQHMSLDASIMNCADDIAYPVHDLEDFIRRRMLTKDTLLGVLTNKNSPFILYKDDFKASGITEKFWGELFEGKCISKKNIGHFINLAITTAYIQTNDDFEHSLFKHNLKLEKKIGCLLKYINDEITLKIVKTPEVFMLERKGALMIEKLFDEYMKDPINLIPSWEKRSGTCIARKVCDYIAGMTDRYITKMYQRLFMPGIGSSRDEL